MSAQSDALASTVEIKISVNGTERRAIVEVNRSLLDVIRDVFELTGTKECCAVGECGACTVLVGGRSVNSCLMLAVEANGTSITTVEGLAETTGMSRLQESFLEEGAVQCGFCIPGMLISATALLDQHPHPSGEEIREALSGNLCRCGGYSRIVRAVESAIPKDSR